MHTTRTTATAILLTGAMVAPAWAAKIDSYVYSTSFPAPDTVQQIATTTEGQLITSTSQGVNPLVGVSQSWAQAQTFYGTNRVSVEAQSLYHVWPSGSHDRATSSAYASSHWQDALTVTGGNVGDLVSLTFSGTVEYSLSLDDPVTGGKSIGATFTAISPVEKNEAAFVSRDFVVADANTLTWSLTVAARSGDQMQLTSSFYAMLDAHDYPLGEGRGEKNGTFEAGSFLQSISLTEGYGLRSETDALSTTAGGFAYLAAPVPEPASYALLAAGLLTVGCAVRSRGGQVPR